MGETITDTAITRWAKEAAATKREIIVTDAGQRGLRLHIYKTGVRTWRLHMRDRLGSQRSWEVGEYPAVKVSEARERARKLREEIKAGADPIADKRRYLDAGKAAREGSGTIRAAMTAYEAADPPKSWSHSKKRVERVFDALLDKPAIALTAADLQKTADRYAARASAHFAVRSLRPVLKWAAKRDLLPSGLDALESKPPNQRQRRLDQHELARVLRVLRSDRQPHHLALLFMLHTLVRLEECCGAPWGEFDLERGTWTIAADRTKNGSAHTLDLPRQMVTMLWSIRPETIEPADLVFRTKRGSARLSNWDRVGKAVQKASETTGWTRHDLRRTGATMLGEMGYVPDIIEAGLNHKSIHTPLAATYNASRYRAQVAAALQQLADELEKL